MEETKEEVEQRTGDEARETPVEETAPDEEVVISAAELAQLRRERDEYLDMSKRIQADYINFQNRMKKESEQRVRRAAARLLRDLLPVVDNFERALEAARSSDEPKSFLEGVELIYQDVKQYLEQNQVEPIDPDGKPFDYRVHEALLTEPTDEVAPGTVTGVFEKGYKYKGETLLRPAKVKVSKAPPAPAGSSGDCPQEEE